MPDNKDIHGVQPPNKYWKSIDEYQNDAELHDKRSKEFLDEVKEDFDPDKNLSGLSRRKFLALLGASAALTAAGCSDYPDKGEIVPYSKKPEEIIPGKANYYASTCNGCQVSCGILIKTREGRPIKVEGNPDHPINMGKTCVKGQALVLNLYDPARPGEPYMKRGSDKSQIAWAAADKEIINALKRCGDKEIAVITSTIVSPTFKRILDEFTAAYPSAKIYSYEQFDETARKNAWLRSFGNREIVAADWSKAKILLSLEGDFLGVEGNIVEHTLNFSRNRDIRNAENYSRLYSVEANLSVTGMNADYRIRLKPEYQYSLLMALLSELGNSKRIPGLEQYASLYSSYSLADFASKHNIELKRLKALADDILKNQGKCLVYAGRALDEKTHAAANLINQLIGNEILDGRPSYVEYFEPAGYSGIKGLMDKIKNSQVEAIIHVDTNPVFTLPAEFKYADHLKKVPLTIALSEFENETTNECKFVLPLNHVFESWGDSRVRTDLFTTVQPVIAPLYNTRQKESIFLVWNDGNPNSYTGELYLAYLRRQWETAVYPTVDSSASFMHFWNGALHDGVVKAKWLANRTGQFNIGALKDNSLGIKNKDGYSLLVTESYALGDGRFANNGWLQELPHPVSKVTWDNYAALSIGSARALGVKTNDLVKVEYNSNSVILPVLVQPGLAEKFIAVETGYGRRNGPVVAIEVGHNVNNLLSGDNDGSVFYFTGIRVTKLGETYKLASSQDHHTFDEPLTKDLHKKREIIREGTVAEFIKKPGFLSEEKKPSGENMYAEVEYKDVKWAMAIDLNKCTGCGNCSVACSVENNVPVVGKDQVLLSREMQWMRIDRYYSGTPEDPEISLQPMLCQHCDHAPCENVCPVVATNHSPDGLNQMVYNRCVGTRYCSNNCPYKVRRFNFYNFRDHFQNGHYTQAVMQLAANPEVTVRSRGVMEKCTFCVHRISEARAEATANGKTFSGEGITSACQDACPANAIVFGNVNDTETEIFKLRQHQLGYSVLGELNVQPNVTYLAKLRNTHSEEA